MLISPFSLNYLRICLRRRPNLASSVKRKNRGGEGAENGGFPKGVCDDCVGADFCPLLFQKFGAVKRQISDVTKNLRIVPITNQVPQIGRKGEQQGKREGKSVWRVARQATDQMWPKSGSRTNEFACLKLIN
jgi:hypothetical protein